MDKSAPSLDLDVLISLSKDVANLTSQWGDEVPEDVQALERSVKVMNTWLQRLEGEDTLPPELNEVCCFLFAAM